MEVLIAIIALSIAGAILPATVMIATSWKERKALKPYPGPEIIAGMRASRKRWMQLEQSSMQSWELLCQCPEEKTQDQLNAEPMKEHYEYLMPGSPGSGIPPLPPSAFREYLKATSGRSAYEPYLRVPSSIDRTDLFRQL